MDAPDFGDVIIRLIGTKEESKIATAIAKMTKHRSPSTVPCGIPIPDLNAAAAGRAVEVREAGEPASIVTSLVITKGSAATSTVQQISV